MKRTPIRVEPISSHLEGYHKDPRKGPIQPVVVAGEMVLVSGLPLFLHVPSWPGPFDVEIDCVAVLDN